MKLIILAFILSIVLHFLFLFSYEKVKEEFKSPPSTTKNVSNENKTSTFRYVKLIQQQKQVEQKKVEKPIEKKQVEKKIEKPKEIKKEFKKVEKVEPQKKIPKKQEPKKIIPIPKKQVEAKPNFTKEVPKEVKKPEIKKEPIKEVKQEEVKKEVKKNPLENFFLAEPEPLDFKLLDNETKRYIKLYGEEYQSFTKEEKIFLQNNLKNIGRITQKYLKYPHIAVRTGQQGTNIVEFYLHPNGDITDLKLYDSSGYNALDKNSIETIEFAYKDYPRPKSKTKIRIYVSYKLY